MQRVACWAAGTGAGSQCCRASGTLTAGWTHHTPGAALSRKHCCEPSGVGSSQSIWEGGRDGSTGFFTGPLCYEAPLRLDAHSLRLRLGVTPTLNRSLSRNGGGGAVNWTCVYAWARGC